MVPKWLRITGLDKRTLVIYFADASSELPVPALPRAMQVQINVARLTYRHCPLYQPLINKI